MSLELLPLAKACCVIHSRQAARQTEEAGSLVRKQHCNPLAEDGP